MYIQNYNDAPELVVLRDHPFLLSIKHAAEELIILREEISTPITSEQITLLTSVQKLIVALEFNRGNLVENCKNRAYIKYKMAHVLDNDRITIQAIKHEYRSYMLECVILFDRLSNLLGMLSDCFTPEGIFFTDDEEHFLGFFNPLVNDFRNVNIHGYYDSHFNWVKAVLIEGQTHEKRFRGDFDTEIETILLAELSKIIK